MELHDVRPKKFRSLSEILLATSPVKLDSKESHEEHALSKRLKKESTSKVASDYCCGRCGSDGDLGFCSNCPSAFHPACVYAQEIPEGNWYCAGCTCQICSHVIVDSPHSGNLICSQCEQRYHVACLQQRGLKLELAPNMLCCSESCEKVYSGLQSRIGRRMHLSDEYCWTLLKCIHGDTPPEFVALQAECNSKLASALSIMKDCFAPMVDPRTRVEMLQQVVYNCGSEFARLNYSGFYNIVLEHDDIMMATASIRIHGAAVAEVPLIATCRKYRRQGMCRRLINSIEEMLKCLKVRKLVLSAIPETVKTWTEGFGFHPLEDDEKRALSNVNLMVFPEVVYLKKQLCEIDGPEV